MKDLQQDLQHRFTYISNVFYNFTYKIFHLRYCNKKFFVKTKKSLKIIKYIILRDYWKLISKFLVFCLNFEENPFFIV